MPTYALVLKEYTNGQLVGSVFELPRHRAKAEARYLELATQARSVQGTPAEFAPRFFVGQVDFETELRLGEGTSWSGMNDRAG